MLIRARVTAATPCQMIACVTLAKLWNSWDGGFAVRPVSHPFSWTRAPSFAEPAMSFRSGVLPPRRSSVTTQRTMGGPGLPSEFPRGPVSPNAGSKSLPPGIDDQQPDDGPPGPGVADLGAREPSARPPRMAAVGDTRVPFTTTLRRGGVIGGRLGTPASYERDPRRRCGEAGAPSPRCAIRARARAARLSPARREQAGDGLPPLHAAGARSGARRVASRVRRLQPAAAAGAGVELA